VHRDRFLRSQGWYTLRVWNSDVFEAPDDVVDNVCRVARRRIDRNRV
jgi:very-short-patch-repair endonuclease